MPSNRAGRRWYLWIPVVFLVMAAGAWFIIRTAERSVAPLEEYGRVPPFEFTAHTGDPFGLETMKGRLNVVDFMFTSCRTACPIMSAQMQELYEEFRGSEKVQFVSFSVDPGVDTLPVLRDYAARHGVDDERWLFVRGPVEKVRDLSEKGFYLPAEGLPMGHSTRFVLVDGEGNIRGYYDSFSEEKLTLLRNDIRRLWGQVP